MEIVNLVFMASIIIMTPAMSMNAPAIIMIHSSASLWKTRSRIPRMRRRIPDIRESLHGLNFSMVTSMGITGYRIPLRRIYSCQGLWRTTAGT